MLSSIDQRTSAIGLGSETQVSTAALNTLTQGTGGYLLLTGSLTSSIDDLFRLRKYFLQILAGVTNTSVVLDPNGYVGPATPVRIPFELNETDIVATPILLTEVPAVRFTLETPAGDRIDPAVAASFGGVFTKGTNMGYYRFTLPAPVGDKGAGAGTWHAVLEVDRERLKREASRLDNDPGRLSSLRSHGVRYSLIVHAYSNLRFGARLLQDSLEPGARMTLRARLTEFGIPVEQRASVTADLERPDGSTARLELAEVEPGTFEATTPATNQGSYRFRVVAPGGTLRGAAFTREQLVTGAVLPGGNGPFPFGGDDPDGRWEKLCRLADCLLEKGVLDRFLEQQGIERKALEVCLKGVCEPQGRRRGGRGE